MKKTQAKETVKKQTGRPPIDPNDRRLPFHVNTTAVMRQKATDYFGTPGKAIDWAVTEWERQNKHKK